MKTLVGAAPAEEYQQIVNLLRALLEKRLYVCKNFPGQFNDRIERQ